jgi:hypothetical protein
MTSRAVRAAVACSLALGALAACGEGAEPNASPNAEPTRTSSPPAGAEVTWLAVVDVAPGANDLDALTRRLLEPLGRAIMVAPVDCFDGLPPDVRDGYLIGAVGDTRAEVERLIEDAGEEVSFSAHVVNVCTD